MSITLNYRTNFETLSTDIGRSILAYQKKNDLFSDTFVIVPNRNIRKILYIQLSKNFEIFTNSSIHFLEEGLFTLLSQLYTSIEGNTDSNLKQISASTLQYFIVSSLYHEIEANNKELGSLKNYFFQNGSTRRDFDMRVWQLSEKLATYFVEYEFNFSEMITKNWRLLKKEASFLEELFTDSLNSLDFLDVKKFSIIEKTQRYLYRNIYGKSDGLLRLYSSSLKNKQQYYTSLFYLKNYIQKHKAKVISKKEKEKVFIFMLPPLASFFYDCFSLLGEYYDIEIYRLQYTNTFKKINPKNTLLEKWGQTYIDDINLLTKKFKNITFDTSNVSNTLNEKNTSLLNQIKNHIFENSNEPIQVDQDASIQIVGAPGVYREVETVRNSILDNLKKDSSLLLSDIAIIVTDMSMYRSAIQSVFSKGQDTLPYNLNDINTKTESMFAQCLINMLRLSLGSFNRKQVFEVVLNPCFLAGSGIDREDAIRWLNWSDSLNIFHSIDTKDRKYRNYMDGNQFTWEQGFKRLRLGRIMEVPGDEVQPKSYFAIQNLAPYYDIDSGNSILMERFFTKVEGMLVFLHSLRSLSLNGIDWISKILYLIETFIGVPQDRKEEENVKLSILNKLQDLEILDLKTKKANTKNTFSLTTIIQFIESNLDGIVTSIGANLTSGITISSLYSLRFLPYKVLYVVGLSEGVFPRGQEKSGFNLSIILESISHKFTDYISKKNSDEDRLLLLQALFSAQQKLYLFYTNRNLQKDEVIYRSSCLEEFIDYLSLVISKSHFHLPSHLVEEHKGLYLFTVPLSSYHEVYYQKQPEELTQLTDVFTNYSITDSIYYYIDTTKEKPNILEQWKTEFLHNHSLEKYSSSLQKLFEQEEINTKTIIEDKDHFYIHIHEIKNFLREPLNATLRKRLGLEIEEEPAFLKETEAFVLGNIQKAMITTGSIQAYILKQEPDDETTVFTSLKERFDWQTSQSNNPEGEFGIYNYEKIKNDLQNRIFAMDDKNSIKSFLKKHFLNYQFMNLSFGDRKKTYSSAYYKNIGVIELIISNTDHPIQITLRGFIHFLWKHKTKKEVDILIVTNSKSSESGKTYHLLDAFLFFVLCQSNLSPELSEFYQSTFTFYVSHPKGIKEWKYVYSSSINYRAYLEELIVAYLYETNTDLIPIDMLAKQKKLQPPENETLSDTDYYNFFTEELSKHTESRHVSELPDFIQVAGYKISSTIKNIVNQRYGLFFQEAT